MPYRSPRASGVRRSAFRPRVENLESRLQPGEAFFSLVPNPLLDPTFAETDPSSPATESTIPAITQPRPDDPGLNDILRATARPENNLGTPNPPVNSATPTDDLWQTVGGATVAGWDLFPMETVAFGYYSGYGYFDYSTCAGLDALIQDQVTWEKFWAQHTSIFFPAPPAPAIDFQSEMVIVDVMGCQSSGGPSTSIAGVWYDPDEAFLVTLIIDDRTPGFLTVISNPYHFVKVPAVPVAHTLFYHEDVCTALCP